MNNKEILNHLKNSINYAPINILENIMNTEVIKMTEHDDITRQEETSQSKTNTFSYKPLISLASFAVIIFLIFIGIWQLRIPDSQIYLDVNPSIQITTNKRNKVIKLTAINEDSVDIIEDIDYKNKDYEEVTEEVVKHLALEAKTNATYMDDEKGVMLVSIYNKDSKKRDEQAILLDKNIREQLDSYQIHPVLLTQSIDKTNTIEEFSKEYKISVGKMTFIRNLIVLNPELKTEDLVSLSLYELLEVSRNTGIEIDKILETGNDERVKTTAGIEEPSSEEPSSEESQEEPFKEPSSTPTSTPTKPEETKDTSETSPKPTIEPTIKPTDKPAPTPSHTSKPAKKPISNEKAKEIALERTGPGRVVKIELDDDEYEIEIIGNDGYEYELEIDAYTGEIEKIEKDKIDDDDYDDDDDDDDDD